MLNFSEQISHLVQVLVDLAHRGQTVDVFSFTVQVGLALELDFVRFLRGVRLRFIFMGAFTGKDIMH